MAKGQKALLKQKFLDIFVSESRKIFVGGGKN